MRSKNSAERGETVTIKLYHLNEIKTNYTANTLLKLILKQKFNSQSSPAKLISQFYIEMLRQVLAFLLLFEVAHDMSAYEFRK
jgi:hypothetical protein